MAENALSGLKNMKPWQKYAVVGGGAIAAYYVYYKHKQSAANASTASTATTATATGIDPVTGLPYSEDNQVDPATGMTYLQEAQTYGSVSAAESAVSGGYGGYGSYGYGGLYDTSAYGYGSSIYPYSGTQTGTNYTSNAQWAQAVEAGLTDIGYAPTDISAALGRYLAGLSVTSDQASIIQAALAEYGNPPVGSFQVILAPGTTPASTGNNNVTVPNVVGLDLVEAEAAVKNAGLGYSSPPSTPGLVTWVTSQSPAAGTQVASGTVVTVQGSTGASTSHGSNNVTVPDVAGKTDGQATAILEGAGLKPYITFTSVSDKPGIFHIITKTSPAAGSSVPKGTTITMYYRDSTTA